MPSYHERLQRQHYPFQDCRSVLALAVRPRHQCGTIALSDLLKLALL